MPLWHSVVVRRKRSGLKLSTGDFRYYHRIFCMFRMPPTSSCSTTSTRYSSRSFAETTSTNLIILRSSIPTPVVFCSLATIPSFRQVCNSARFKILVEFRAKFFVELITAYEYIKLKIFLYNSSRNNSQNNWQCLPKINFKLKLKLTC